MANYLSKEQCLEHILLHYDTGKRFIVSLGGLSRSGKSTLCNWFLEKLKAIKIHAIVIPLDYWIIPIEKRTSSMTVMDRFQYDNITKDLSSLVEQGSLSLFPYDFQSRSMSTTKIDLTLKESCIAFIDGVIVLDHPYIRKISSLKLYLEEEETIRKGRFIQFYRSKGLLDQELLALYEQRLIDELPHVYKTREIADYIVKM